jgi:hypothetical protein
MNGTTINTKSIIRQAEFNQVAMIGAMLLVIVAIRGFFSS